MTKLASLTVSESIWAQLPFGGAGVVLTLALATALSYRYAKNLFTRNPVFT